ncbi:CU044_5270 family protein [Nonomuraea sediminis]|uniref:CU044_5270 family protein n=1 Tax=Nonomuraea sediminis TaxID=2835864 RepID=UPI001BDD0EDC|nr:CU044_5270 family protein [Nonomuraea sediminis]
MTWKQMKFATTPARRPLIALTVGLAAFLGTPASAVAAPPEGAYWHTRALTTSTHPWRFGTKSDPYSLVEQRVDETWTAPDGRAWFGYRELATLPQSAAGKKAWQRDGSPAKWSESIDGKTVKLSTQPSQGHVVQARKQTSFQLAGQFLTYDEVQRLPADPNRLKDWLTRAGQASRIPEQAMGTWLTSNLPQILHTLPAPKEVRAAAYQALLTMPGVRAEGNATDTLGRSGAAVLIRENGDKDETSTRLIIDTGRMVLLSESQTVTLNGKPLMPKSYKTLIEVGWTNSPPTAPALP